MMAVRSVSVAILVALLSVAYLTGSARALPLTGLDDGTTYTLHDHPEV